MKDYPGTKFKKALETEKPLQIVGVINALIAKMATEIGYKAIYLSGAGVANARYAIPDLALTSLNDVVEEVQKITQATDLPLLVDADTGWGSFLNVSRSIKTISKAGAAAVHIEDQHEAKRCGHREGKQLVSTQHMVGRIKAALDGRDNEAFMIIARTDALAVEGEKATLERAQQYEQAGVHALFLEAVTTLDQYQLFAQTLSIPILANITEFGKTPLFTKDELKQAGVGMILYPLSAFRAMNKAAETVLTTIRQEGTQQVLLPQMQTRQELYQLINYEYYEQQVNNNKEE